MKIIGKELLDSGNYDLITIKNDIIIISNKDSLNDNNVEDDVLLNEIINEFIWNNTIYSVSNNEAIATNNKKIKYDDIYIYLKIKNKYDYDRLHYLYHKESNNYNITSSNDKSYYLENKYCLKKKEDKLIYEELKFLNDILEYIFIDEIAYLTFENDKMIIMNLDKSKTIKFSNELKENNLSIICELVSNHNKNIFDKRVIRKRKIGGK